MKHFLEHKFKKTADTPCLYPIAYGVESPHEGCKLFFVIAVRQNIEHKAARQAIPIKIDELVQVELTTVHPTVQSLQAKQL